MSIAPICFLYFTKDNSSLSNDHVTNLFYDGSRLWVGTYVGLNFVSKSSFEIFNLENSGVANETLSFTQDLQERLWVGTYNGLYFKERDSDVHQPARKFFSKFVIEDERVMSVSVRGQELWLGYRHNGVQIVDLQSGVIYKQDFPGNPNLGVTKILHTLDASTWIGTYNNGLYRIRSGNAEPFYSADDTDEFLLSEKSITALFETNDNGLLIGTEGGIYQYNTVTGKITAIPL